MKKIIIYGNCHTGLIISYLNASSEFRTKYEILSIPQIQEIYNENKNKILTIPFEECDIFVHQSIQKNNKYGEIFSSENIIKRLKKECRIIAIPNLYGLPLYLFPQCIVKEDLKFSNISYFFRDCIIDRFVSEDISIDNLVVQYKNNDFYSDKQLENLWDSFVKKLCYREKDWDIKISEYIIKNKNKKLFFDPNHPTNEVIEQIVIELCRFLKIDINIEEARKCVKRQLDVYEIPLSASVINYFGIKNERYIRKSTDGKKMYYQKMDLKRYIEQYVALLWKNGKLDESNADIGEKLYKKAIFKRRITLCFYYFDKSINFINRRYNKLLMRIRGCRSCID